MSGPWEKYASQGSDSGDDIASPKPWEKYAKAADKTKKTSRLDRQSAPEDAPIKKPPPIKTPPPIKKPPPQGYWRTSPPRTADEAASIKRSNDAIGAGLVDPVVGVGQLAANIIPGTSVAKYANNLVAQREKGLADEGITATNPYRIAGNIASPVNYIPVVRGLDAVEKLGAGGKVLWSAATGAATGAETPVTGGDYWKQKAEQAGVGAVTGGAFSGAGELAGKLVEPTTNAAKAMLMKAGVNLTPGQMAGQVGKRVEEGSKSLPFAGSVVRGAEGRTLDSFNVATAQRALEPIGTTLKAKTGRDAIVEGQSALDRAYDAVLDKIPSFHVDPTFKSAIDNLRTMAAEMPPAARDQFETILKNRVGVRLSPTGTMDGRTLKKVESELGQKSRSLKSSQDASQRDVGYALDEVKGAIRDALARQYPDAAKELSAVNKAYSLFANVELASSRRAVSGGQFTPGDLLQAIKREDRSPRDRQFGAGNRPLQDWAESAQEIIGNKLPDSGTAERLHLGSVGLLTGLAALPATLGHTETGQNLLRLAATAVPDFRNRLAERVRNVAPYAGAAGSAGVYNALVRGGLGQTGAQ